HLDVGHALAGQLGERVEQLGSVLFLRKEEGVLGGTAIVVAESVGNRWPVPDPACHACGRGVEIGLAPAWFIVVGEGEPDRGGTVERLAPESAPDQAGQPELGVAWQSHAAKWPR